MIKFISQIYNFTLINVNAMNINKKNNDLKKLII